MATISAGMVKELRDKTGAGMMDCKSALKESDGDLETAVDWLRTKGLAKAAKKAGRVAAEGLIGVAGAANTAAMVEVNSETDFVARNEKFQDMVAGIAELGIAAAGDFDKLLAGEFSGAGKSVADHVTEMVATIGENLSVRRVVALSADPGVVATYVHNAVRPGLGKIGVLVALKSEGDVDKLTEFGRKIAMHIAAVNPLALAPEDLTSDIIERERAVLVEQARASGKPENIIEKMVDGRMRKFYEEVVLLAQTFVVEGDSTVAKAVEAAAKYIGSAIEITAFARFALGEGIDKRDDDFAAEVAAAAAG